MSAAPEAARPAGVWAAVWRWLRYGRHYGAGGFSVYRATRATRWGIPQRIWRTFRRRQVVELTPIIYIVVLAAGSVIGVVLQLTLGLWWWMPGAALLVALWLLEATSAFWGGQWGRHPYTWRTELLAAVSPQRGGLARRTEDRAKLLSSGLPFFAPVGWTGRLAFGGWGGNGRELSTVSIVCLPPRQEFSSGSELALTTESGDREEDSVRRLLVDADEGGVEWTVITLEVERTLHAGFGVERGGVAYRYARIDGGWLTVRGPLDLAESPLTRVDPESVTGW